MVNNFPNLNLEDKVVFKGDGIVMGENAREEKELAESEHVENTRQAREWNENAGMRRSTRSKRDHPMWGEFVKH